MDDVVLHPLRLHPVVWLSFHWRDRVGAVGAGLNRI